LPSVQDLLTDEWPEMRVAAFHNGYFIALCNRVGAEECLTFAGESFVCAPDGNVIARGAKTEAEVVVAELADGRHRIHGEPGFEQSVRLHQTQPRNDRRRWCRSF
jgi:predicted amidohydrolase